MRRTWLGVFAVMAVGVPLSACGSPFESLDGDSGTGDDASDTTDAMGEVDGSPLEGGEMPDTSMPHEGGDAHHDAMADNNAPDMGMVGVDSGTPDTSMLPDTSTPDSSTPDTGPTPDACALDVADESVGVFVSPGGPTSGCGSKAVPCGTFQAAYAVATGAGKNAIFVNQGTYTETVTLVSNINIRGGWVDVGGTWSRNCSAGNAASYVIKAPAGSNQTIIANNVTGVMIDTISVASKDAANVGAGESIYGIFATGSTSLTLVNVDVSVVAGGTGGGGSVGGAGSNASGVCVTASDGASGATGGGGAAGQPGAFGSGGYTPASGGVGVIGSTGDDGTLSAPQCCGAWVCGVAGDNSCDGTHTLSQHCGGAGMPGCPGGGALGGTGGVGGGSSIAVYAFGASISAANGVFAAGNGGAGGAGGAGGTQGGAGSAGTTGSQGAACGTGCLTHYDAQMNASCRFTSILPGSGGGVGGAGGSGGNGGQGGGGAGGYSYSYYVGGGGSVSPNGTMLTFGTAGAPGSGGNAGAPGGAGQHN